MLGDEALILFIAKCKKQGQQKILEIGPGKNGQQTDKMRNHGLMVETVDIIDGATHVGDYTSLPSFDAQFDGIWASHVLEHSPNPGLFLQRIFNDTKLGGVVAITVPPSKPTVVSGHLTIWNAGLLLYNMIAAGFNCHNAAVSTYGYNVSVVVEKQPTHYKGPVNLQGPLLNIKHLFPAGVLTDQNKFNGNITDINWR